jgi:hypothetical protein
MTVLRSAGGNFGLGWRATDIARSAGKRHVSEWLSRGEAAKVERERPSERPRLKGSGVGTGDCEKANNAQRTNARDTPA